LVGVRGVDEQLRLLDTPASFGRAWTQRLFGGSLGKRARSWTSRNGSKSTEEEA
jgi:hypothetical protein